MNEFMEALNTYGWTLYYFAGFVTGCVISLIVGALSLAADAIVEVSKNLKEKGKKNA